MDTRIFLYFEFYANTTLFILLLSLFQLWPLEALSSLLCLFDTRHHFLGGEHFLSGTTRCFRATAVCKAFLSTCKKNPCILIKKTKLYQANEILELFVSKCNVDQWFSNTQVFLGPAASVSVGNLLDMHILWFTPWYNEQKQMGTWSVFHKPSSIFLCTLKFKNLWSRLHEFCEWQHKRHKLSESFGCLRLLYVVPKQTLKKLL